MLSPELTYSFFSCYLQKLKADMLLPFELFGEPWVLFRDEHGHAACLQDECAHRACPLSVGTLEAGRVQCPYHGWEYSGSGQCTSMPSTVMCKEISIRALRTEEKDGFIWVWPGEQRGGQHRASSGAQGCRDRRALCTGAQVLPYGGVECSNPFLQWCLDASVAWPSRIAHSYRFLAATALLWLHFLHGSRTYSVAACLAAGHVAKSCCACHLQVILMRSPRRSQILHGPRRVSRCMRRSWWTCPWSTAC